MNTLKPIVVATTLAFASLSSIAFADDGYYRGYGDTDGGRYGRPDTAEVLEARPIYGDVRINEPRQQCYQQEVRYDDSRYDNRGLFLGTIIGGVVGGVVGHQFGRGGGRAAATAIGAVVGAGAGNAIGGQNDRYYGGERVGYQDRCDTVNQVHYEQRVQGYDVTYRYRGQIYHTRTAYDPGDRIPVTVNVAPATGSDGY